MAGLSRGCSDGKWNVSMFHYPFSQASDLRTLISLIFNNKLCSIEQEWLLLSWQYDSVNVVWGKDDEASNSAFLQFHHQTPRKLHIFTNYKHFISSGSYVHHPFCLQPVNIYQKWVTSFGRTSGTCPSSVYLQLSVPRRLLTSRQVFINTFIQPWGGRLLYVDGR